MKKSGIPLLRKALEDAEANPGTTDLSWWARRTPCGTTMCLAARVATAAGYEIDWTRSFRGDETSLPGDLCSYTTSGALIADVACRELGLTPWEEKRLFYRGTLDEAWAAAERITGGEITKPLRGRGEASTIHSVTSNGTNRG